MPLRLLQPAVRLRAGEVRFPLLRRVCVLAAGSPAAEAVSQLARGARLSSLTQDEQARAKAWLECALVLTEEFTPATRVEMSACLHILSEDR